MIQRSPINLFKANSILGTKTIKGIVNHDGTIDFSKKIASPSTLITAPKYPSAKNFCDRLRNIPRFIPPRPDARSFFSGSGWG